MSDASRLNLKVSREGIVLIKSFEGFRPRAVRREDGRWVIGYGHTLSAREGAGVSESDAELLLRYDLLPVEKSLNADVPPGLNQHQFDALVSFAFSVGLDRFAGSDVLRSLVSGARQEAADAMVGWPEPTLPETTLRRRVAERALFVADPASPVTLADLLSAPLPPPPVSDGPASPPEPQPAVEEEAGAISSSETRHSLDARGAALASLLGEPDKAVDAAPEPGPGHESDPVIPVFADVSPVASSSTEPPVFTPELIETPTEASEGLTEEEETAPLVSQDPAPDASTQASLSSAPDDDGMAAEVATVDALDLGKSDSHGSPSDPEPLETDAADHAATPPADPVAMAANRYAPYSAAMVGPLPYLQTAAPRVQDVPPEAPDETPPPIVPSMAPAVVEPVADTVGEAVLAEPEPTTELVLTPPEDRPEPALARPLWTPEQRADPDSAAAESNLFSDDLSLTLGTGPILRHEVDVEAPSRFDWSETGAFIIMGGVGLTAFGASMAAFRLASEQSNGGPETTLIAWVLALIGAACVGVSSFNLYRRWGLPGGD